ncbi:hypothetical protein KJI95_16280 [Shewanella sp. JM162201]|uniref:Immunity protein 30 domain-containing protein n=1 Tax=Shewanella jiangmenensis TaxID=2837387 RepID=A0ABS5V6J0_9GAMM|nr:hypothetical protein [Shewanella jiangmenensis]MBT1446054.1 hypothetical protein [Shewanella jiangmenensis]
MDFEIELQNIQFDEYDEADMEALYDFIDRLEELPNKREAIPAIFSFIEKFNDKELGSPGPLVHFIEEEDDYHDYLKESLSRKCTGLTVWMVNRILNSLPEEGKNEWLISLELASKCEYADEIAKGEAQRYLEFHRGEI